MRACVDPAAKKWFSVPHNYNSLLGVHPQPHWAGGARRDRCFRLPLLLLEATNPKQKLGPADSWQALPFAFRGRNSELP